MKIIIILGSNDKNTMTKRVNRALEYFNTNQKQYYDEQLGELVIQQYLLLCGTNERINGIHPKFCLYSENSTNTIENLEFSKKLIEEIFKNVCVTPTIVICTSSFHIKRSAIYASFIFKDYPLEFIHTNEFITKKEYKNEERLLNNFFDENFGLIFN